MEKGRVDFKVSVVPFNRVTYMEKNIFKSTVRYKDPKNPTISKDSHEHTRILKC